MYGLKKNGKLFTSKFVGAGPSSYEKRIYRAAVSQTLRNTDLEAMQSSIYYPCDARLFCCTYLIYLRPLFVPSLSKKLAYLKFYVREFLICIGILAKDINRIQRK